MPWHMLMPGFTGSGTRHFRAPIARTTIIIADEYHWPTLKRDIRGYVLSSTCRMHKRPWSIQLRILPARFLRPCEVLEMDILDM